MRTTSKPISGFLLSLALSVGTLSSAFADDTEIYVGAVSTVKPNILFIVDTSISMNANDVVDDHPTFNPTGNYGSNSGNCNGSYNRLFFTTGNEPVPTCASNNYIIATTTSYQRCDKLAVATASAASAPAGRWTGKAAQYNTGTRIWEDIQPGGLTRNVECFADNGIHGTTAASASRWARNGNASGYTTDANLTINWSQRKTYTFYSERWVRWNSMPTTVNNLTRLQAVKNAVYDMVSSIDEVNLGIMRFNGDSGLSGDAQFRGGVVTNAIADVTTARNNIISTVSGFSTNSGTPLSETLHEAGLYWSGSAVGWGGSGAAAAITSGIYNSPITESCQRNFNILLTDGRPTWDNQDDSRIETLYGSACTGAPGDPGLGWTTNVTTRRASGRCLDEMSAYLNRETTDLRPDASMPGNQRVKTYTIGFGVDPGGAFDFLTEVATDGGGTRYLATNTNQLSQALTSIATDILNVSSTFSTASIGVSAFNRASSRDDLYFAVFSADDHLRWDGNLKKYKLAAIDPDGAGPIPARLVVADATPPVASAVDDATGFFLDGTRSYWSAADDGNEVTEGGAVSRLPAAASRTLLTHIGANPAGTAANLIAIDNAAVTDAILGTNATAPTRADVIAFARGTTQRMGDPLHSQPSVVTYGGTAAAPIDVVYVATNDGFLHAVDAATGVEKWAFVPQELLGRLKSLVTNPAATTRTYGLDGDVRILRLDRDGDGVIEPLDGDTVWLYVGMRRGGQQYYALNVTNPDDPRLLFKIGSAGLPGVGETWSPPTIARVEVTSETQNAQKLVLIFGGGYDGVQENYAQVDDSVGNRVFMVDARTGALLWSAGNNATDNDLVLASMTNSIPGRISVLDINGDGFADRMYAADMGGRIFRFDIFSGRDADELVTGSVFAKLGEGLAAGSSPGTPDIANTRRFYNAPDVALIQRRGSDPYYNIAIGSGYRGHPLHTETQDRFYSLRDKNPYTKFATNNAITTITEATAGLVNVPVATAASSVVAESAPGWMMVFDPSATDTGEKVLNESTTVNNVILFSTYQPQAASSSEPCRPTSVNRVYAVRADNGRPALDLNNDGVINNNDLFESVAHEGILGGVNVGVLRGDLADALGGTSTVCLAGMHILGKCVAVSDSVRTYWRRDVDQP